MQRVYIIINYNIAIINSSIDNILDTDIRL